MILEDQKIKDNTVGSRSKIDLAYIAGFLDGDGSLMLQIKKRTDGKNKFRFMATICFYQDARHEKNLYWIRKILGIGYSVYPGSYHEPEILAQAASVVSEAHKNGYISVLWIYPRGQSVKNEKDPHLIAGAAGLGVTLGADFVKVNFPSNSGNEDFYAFREAVLAAGRTGVICAGGSSMGKSEFLERLYQQIHISGARGNATGRNIHERSLKEAVQFANAVFAITVEGAEVHEALRYIDSKN